MGQGGDERERPVGLVQEATRGGWRRGRGAVERGESGRGGRVEGSRRRAARAAGAGDPSKVAARVEGHEKLLTGRADFG